MVSSNLNNDLRNSSDDKRYLPRWSVSSRIVCKLPKLTNAYECVSRDLSCTGASIVSPAKISSNQKIALTVHLNPQISFDVTGRVVWNKVDGAGNVLGVVFLDVTPEIQDLILQHAFEVKREDLRKHWFQGWDKKDQ